MTDSTDDLAAALRALPVEVLAQARLEVDEVRPDVREALGALSRGDVELAESQLSVTAAYLDARHEVITSAIAANSLAAQQN